MNCQKFESVVSELARGQMMTAEQRGAALAHSDACDDCAARLRDEEMLTRGLQSLASDMESLEAPAEIETSLLNAFRASRAVTPIASRRSNSRYWLTAAVAAMLLIAISVIAFRATRRVEVPREVARQDQRQDQPQEKREIKNDPQPAPQVVVPNEEHVAKNSKPRRVRPTNADRRENQQVANHVNSEIATDFIPLSYMSAASLQDGGQIVRVELPRSALANFGLPANMDRNERVKADVLYGIDGLAHAIRFVQ